MGILISESGRESNLKSVFTRAGLSEPGVDNFRLQETQTKVKKTTYRKPDFILVLIAGFGK